MTARDDMGAKQKGYSLGIDDYMVKPIEMNEYLEVSVKSDLVQLCSDCCHALSWTIINSSSRIYRLGLTRFPL